MSNTIFEEEQAAQQPSAGAPSPGGSAIDKIRKQARQLAYDTRYKVKGQFKDGQKADAASLKRAYLSQLQKSSAAGPVKALAKKMLVGEEYDFMDVDSLVDDTVTNVFKKVFSEGSDTVYQIRVTDKETKQTYYRKANRAKIEELRANPKISSVEITKAGDAYDKNHDRDGDGKKESPSKEHAGVVHNAIQRKKGGKPDGQDTRNEEFIGEIKDPEEDNPEANVKKVDVMKGKNKINIMPTQSEALNPDTGDKEQPGAAAKTKEDSKDKRIRMMKRIILQKKMQAVRGGAGADIVAHNEPEGEVIKDDAQYGYDKDGKSLNPADKDKTENPPNSVVFDGGAVIKPIGDEREMPTIVTLIKNKLRARGLNMSQELEGNLLTEENEVIQELVNEGVEAATEYFYKEGLNAEGLTYVIEDVGIEEFTEFVFELSHPEQLNEDEAAYQKAKKKAITGSNRREREGKGEFSPQEKGSKSPYAKEGLGVKSKKKPKIGHTGTKVVDATAKAKKKQPLKPTSKKSIGDTIRGTLKKGVEAGWKRHKEATKGVRGEIKKIAKTAKDTAKQHSQHRKDFTKGISPSDREKKIAKGVGSAVKKALTSETELEGDQLQEETSVERIDRKSKENVAKQRAKVEAETAAREKRTAAFQAHKKDVLSKGGRPVDALDSWQKKKLNNEFEARGVENIIEKLRKGTRGKVGFQSGQQDIDTDNPKVKKVVQAMKEKNPRTGRMRKSSPELKAIGAHSRHKKKQWDAEAKGDYKSAEKHKSRRDAQAFKIYQKSGRIVDRADND